MTKRRRKRKKNKQLETDDNGESLIDKGVEKMPFLPGTVTLEAGKTISSSSDILIKAPVRTCFGILTSQLEQSHNWDPIIINTRPVSGSRKQIGATSHVALSLGRMKAQSLAMITRYHPNRFVSWTLTGKRKVREDWRLKRKPRGTMVHMTLAHEVNGGVIGRILYKGLHKKRIEDDIGRMLTQLKVLAESTN
jgi:hypothetical protein